ncbi:MAG TPA: adenylate/guanylate cyclase domain-containing protein, partial [Nevskia sp.]|nr:adenylate/guanylate cyclase domain-containing protein [Nevskia sp.]
MTQRIWIRVGISAAVFLLFLLQTAGMLRHNLLDEMEAFSYDARLLLTLPRTVDKRIVIVDLDERSLATEGWPWPRARMAELVRQLFDHYNVRVLGFDVDFAQPDSTAGAQLLDSLAQGPLADLPGFAQRLPGLHDQLDGDRIFAAALNGKPVVLGLFLKQSIPQGESASSGAVCAPVIDAAGRSLLDVGFLKAEGYGGNVAPLQAAAPACGFFDNPGVDPDGQFRRVPLLQEFQGQIYPSLALAVTQLALGNAPVSLEFDPPDVKTSLHLERLRVGQGVAPVDGQAAIYVPYRGPQGSFPYVSATDVLHGKADPELLKGAVVLLGTTAAGLLDFRSTPLSNVFPGVEVHANIISGLLDGRIKQKAPYYSGIEASLLLLIAALMTLLYPRLSPLVGGLLVLGIILALTILGFAAWSSNFITPLGIPVVFVLTLFLAQMLYSYFGESRRARDISKRFGQYVPPEIVTEMANNPDASVVKTENRDMTVLFSDIRGFTTISEQFRDRPEELSAFMNEFLGVLTEVVFRHRGTVDKYMGDAVMAFWGAPLEDSQHALHALEAAIEFPTALRSLDASFEQRGWPKLQAGVGLNSGDMRVGNFGSELRFTYTVLGDTVNTGSRLEGATKRYGVAVICGEATRAGAPDWAFRELDLVRVKGKNEPVTIYEPLGPKDAVDAGLKQDLTRLRQALRAYRAQRWDEA